MTKPRFGVMRRAAGLNQGLGRAFAGALAAFARMTSVNGYNSTDFHVERWEGGDIEEKSPTLCNTTK